MIINTFFFIYGLYYCYYVNQLWIQAYLVQQSTSDHQYQHLKKVHIWHILKSDTGY